MVEFHSTNGGKVPQQQLKAAYAENRLAHDQNLTVHSKVPKTKLTQVMCSIGMYFIYKIHIPYKPAHEERFWAGGMITVKYIM